MEHKIFNSDGDLTDLITYKYDKNGNEIEEANFTAAGLLVISRDAITPWSV
jgi:hypothetical protein